MSTTNEMDSILGNAFLSIQERIATLPEFKFIDQDLGQLEIDEVGERESPVAFPCALTDFVDIRYTDNGLKTQQGEGILEVRVALLAYAAATHYFELSHKMKSLGYWNVEHRLNKVLHGWGDDRFFNPLSRVSASTERRKDNIRVRVIRYSFGFIDYMAINVPAKSIDRPDLDVNTAA